MLLRKLKFYFTRNWTVPYWKRKKKKKWAEKGGNSVSVNRSRLFHTRRFLHRTWSIAAIRNHSLGAEVKMETRTYKPDAIYDQSIITFLIEYEKIIFIYVVSVHFEQCVCISI